MSIEAKFKKAIYLIKNGPPSPNATNETKLNYYAFFKQATEGDVKGSQPAFYQLEARAKWDAWNKLKGMAKEEAMEKYVGLLAADDEAWESHPALADYSE
eukprot:TRINITY_DN3763_c0_g2_i1.p1 TRINITY_DN3763_c0_g2~~TRINITY_DN3763_c0_g2_i1.p1  ORF type:complete len:100 (+),score=19.07 TRINITY_DN3763_c0_g2_i1:165-464(+)